MTVDNGSSDTSTTRGSAHPDSSRPAPDHADSGNADSGNEVRKPRDLIDRAERLSPRSSFRIGLLVGVVVTVAVGLLIVQNGSSARLNWAWSSFDAPLWIFLALTLVAGFVLGLVVPALARRARRRARERKSALAQARSAMADAETRRRPPGRNSTT